MPNIIDILARAQSLMNETALNSITPPRAGGIMYDTLLVLNQMQLDGASLLISKVYASVSAMEADTTPTSDLTGRALKPGQLVVIVTSNTSSSDMGSEYRYNGPGSWTYVGKVGGLPLDTEPTENSTKGITSGGVYTALAAMKAEGYKYMGLATPGSGGTSPGTPNQPVFYIAGPGSYPNFGSITVASGYLGFIKYSSGSWSVDSIEVGKDYDAQISQLEHELDSLVIDNSFSDYDLLVADENGNALAAFGSGHIRTKKFDSSVIGKTHWYGKSWMGFGTSITNTSSEGKYPIYLAQLSGLIFNNHGHSGGGITSVSDESVYDDIMSADFTGIDLVTLEVGANDASAPFRHIQANSNAQVVVLCSPSGRYRSSDPTDKYNGNEQSGSDNHTILDRNLAIQKVCMLNSCWFIPGGAMDGFGYARMNASDNYNVDNIHQTNLGGYNFAQAIWAFLKNIPLFYTNIN